jgi:hypothetical protein
MLSGKIGLIFLKTPIIYVELGVGHHNNRKKRLIAIKSTRYEDSVDIFPRFLRLQHPRGKTFKSSSDFITICFLTK